MSQDRLCSLAMLSIEIQLARNLNFKDLISDFASKKAQHWALGVCSLFGNSTLLYVSYKKKRLLKPAEIFIINLAISDMGLTLSLYPMAITSSIYHKWLFGKTVCLIYAFCSVLFGICSLTTLTLLSMVCFVKSIHPSVHPSISLSISPPIHSGNRFNPGHGRLLIVCAWVWALVFAFSPLAHWGEYGPEPYGTACCIDWRLSNLHPVARSYTTALFILCYIVPCCIITVSYTGILMTVRASRKAMEHHEARPAKMSNIQAVIVKLSVAVCIGFFTAWSPYAVVSMWAAFGHMENIPPLAFAILAMFSKSSTIYNPIIYLLLRPNFRRVMYRALLSFRRACLKGCLCSCSQGAMGKCRSGSVVQVSLRSLRRPLGHDQSCIIKSSANQALAGYRGCSSTCEKCSDAFECFRHYPRDCHGGTNPPSSSVNTNAPQDQLSTEPQLQLQPLTQKPTRKQRQKHKKQEARHKKSLRATMSSKRTSEIDNLQINLEMVPGHAKFAWP
ncbi:opsin-5-like [Oncorhynchus tshawytscha]|uniref:opsin-5-like n=1 Tax=Oncorhynchus tshawytscha TaxID=74940 RepID=UPI001C3C7D86|nr:opsin-5-like [Oncorhynchus tshawytscha]